jgi:hypothetical protein
MLPCSYSDRTDLPDDTVRYFQVNRRDLVYLKFILEAYEGMSTMSTVSKDGVIVRITVPAGFAADMDSLLAALATEIPLQETVAPAIGELHA